MILFFRRIREQLASDNKPIKYLRYAIGEIVLVVIGILIAIQINNLNEERKNERQIISILSEVQNDLSMDILNVDELIEFYWEKDSLGYLALFNKFTYEDYKGLPVGLFSLTIDYDLLRIHDNSYNNLMRNIDHIPDKYKPIINQLNKLYIEEKTLIDEYSEQIKLAVLENIKNRSKNKVWYSSFLIGQINDTIIDYYLNDPFYKNEIAYYMFITYNLSLKQFKLDAIEAYISIAKLTGKDKVFPPHISATVVDGEILKEYAGKYKLKKSTSGMKPEFLIVTVDNNRIFNETSDNKNELFQQSPDTFFYLNLSSILTFKRNDSGEVTGMTGKSYFRTTERIKVE